jgi:Glycosyl hydrolases family 2, sugar binding domain/Glycosyl hydrolases family 2/Glycosyl hydrolases family 2, TIM barrel domain
MYLRFKYLLITLLIALISCNKGSFVPVHDTISLGGSWKFAMDTAKAGIREKWFLRSLSDSVNLPGTLDENKKGIPNTNRLETMRLSRELMYAGMAWYQKTVIIPDTWKGQYIRLMMERTKPTQLWVDNSLVGSSTDILTPQYYNLTNHLSPGEHLLTILVNNDDNSVPPGVRGSHAWTEHTQGNWNGIIGKFCLEVFNPVHIESVQVYPDIALKKVTVRVNISNPEGKTEKTRLILKADAWNSPVKHSVPLKSFPVVLRKGENTIDLTYSMGDKVQFWSEFNPALYRLDVALKSRKVLDNATLNFGMRKFSTQGTQFTINGIKTFLRGKHDACVFPLTGHPPMNVESWRKVFRIVKSYNINFYRFHSWTPPLEAFEAADIEGIYLQPELPFWGGFSKNVNSGLNAFLLKEGDHIFDIYGNHPSFVMFALGNELSGDFDVMKEFLSHFKSIDSRHLMAYGSNNYLGFKGQAEGEDYYAACRVGADTDTTYKTQIRGSFSFADANDGGYINGCYPSTMRNYSGAISKCSVPAVGTEVGQYQIYPDYAEIKKYTGVMKPWNLEVFRDRLKENNLNDQAIDFFRASGALSAICYKADIEMALRTPGFGGFHLLDLQDFPGQGTALVGLLDAFMDSKGVITPEEFSHFCNRVVPLVIMEKYCWANNEQLRGKIQVANYSETALKEQPVKWELKNKKGEIVFQGEDVVNISQGGLTNAGSFSIDLFKFSKPERLTLLVFLKGTHYENSYPVWVYNSDPITRVPENILVSKTLDKSTLSKLSDGGMVLLFPDFNDIKDLSVGGLFTPDYWNFRMFKSISESNNKPVSPGTLSILTNPELPLFNNFPTEFYTNWQWWSIIKNSRPLILDNTPKDYRPLVQVVDNIERNHKLGLIFEFSVGKGKLLVCMSDLKKIQDKPEARQLYSSILKYMSSDKFKPPLELNQGDLVALFKTKISADRRGGVKNISY